VQVNESTGGISNTWAAVQNHPRRYADFTYVYPVISRRSGGLSIGINLNPDKRCNFDCVYCEVDRSVPGRATTVDLRQVREELTSMIRFASSGQLARDPGFRNLPAGVAERIQNLAFSGDGEPTMVHNFEECVRLVAEVREQQNLHSTRIVLITDAAGLDKLDVRRGLAIMDRHQGEAWGKLDAGTESYYRRVNRSHVRLERILRNLTLTAQERPIIIQSLFLRMWDERMPAAELEAYCDRLLEIARARGTIREVHAYTIARPTPEPWATRLARSELQEVATSIASRTGLRVRVFD